MRTKAEAMRKAKLLLSRIEGQQGALRLLRRCKLSPRDQLEVRRLGKELREMRQDSKFHIKVIKESKEK